MALDFEPHIERLKQNIGREHGPLTITVERGALLRFSKSIGETNPLYFDDNYAKTTRFGRIIAPPTFVSHWVTKLTEDVYDFSVPGTRSFHTDDIARNYLPIFIGDTITAIARYDDVRIHHGGKGQMLLQTIATTLTNQNGEKVAVVDMIVASFE